MDEYNGNVKGWGWKKKDGCGAAHTLTCNENAARICFAASRYNWRRIDRWPLSRFFKVRHSCAAAATFQTMAGLERLAIRPVLWLK